MKLEGEALASMLKNDAPIHIMNSDLGIDYYGNISIPEEDFGLSLKVLAISLDISPQIFANAPIAGTAFECGLTGDGCVYRFKANYRSSSMLPDTIWYLDSPEFAVREQLRAFVRVPIPLTIRVKFPGDHGAMKNYTDVNLINISGGGICFSYPEPVNIGFVIQVRIDDLPRIGILEAKMTVMHSTPIETKIGLVYHVGASLGSSLTSREQERLVQSIYQLQHNYLKKGLKIPNMSHSAKH